MSCLLSVGVPAVISMLEMGAQGIVQLLLDRESLKPFGAAIGLPIGSVGGLSARLGESSSMMRCCEPLDGQWD